MGKKIIIGIIILVAAALVFSYFKFYHNEAETVASGFKVNTILLKSTVNQGESFYKNIKITNLNQKKEFKVYVKNMDFIYISVPEFNLNKSEEKEITISFEDLSASSLGIYTGLLVIEAGSEKKDIPVILEIQNKNPPFIAIVDTAPGYKEIIPGKNMLTDVKILNQNDSKMHTVELTYLIKNFNDEIITSETENIAVTTENSFSKTIFLPKDLAYGDYVLGIVVKSGGSISTSSDLFRVVEKIEKSGGTTNLTLIFIVVILGVLLIVIFMFVYLMMERDKLFLELRKQHEDEMKFFVKQVEAKKTRKVSKTKNPGEKKKIIKKFKEIKKRVVQKVKEKQKEQKIIFKKLRKEKKRNEMKEKLRTWKKQGFNIKEFNAIFREAEKPLVNMKQWRKQGYDVSALRK